MILHPSFLCLGQGTVPLFTAIHSDYMLHTEIIQNMNMLSQLWPIIVNRDPWHKNFDYAHLVSFFLLRHTKLKNYRAYMNVLHTKRLLYYWRCSFSGLEPRVNYGWWVMAPNTLHCHFPIFHFVCTFMCNLTTMGHIRIFYILDKWSTIGDVHFLV